MRTKLVTTALLGFLMISISAQKPTKYKNIGFKNQGSKTKSAEMEMELLEYYFSYIPSTSYKTNEGKIVSAKSFYMLKFEVPNMFYRAFINDLKSQGRMEEVKAAMPDTSVWGKSNQPYVDYYFQHPMYNQSPVVAVPRIGVKLFCVWLSEKVKTAKLKDWKNKKIEFRLPTEAEWMIAASGGDTNAVYAWKGPYLKWVRNYAKRNEEIYLGDTRANYCRIGDGNVFRDENGKLTVKKSDNEKYASYFPLDYTGEITAPVICYWPNAYGLFCMTGNVREMVQEEGFTKGGSWLDPGGECMIDYRNTFKKEGAPCEGFRIIAVVE